MHVVKKRLASVPRAEHVLLDNSVRLVYTVRMIIDTHCHLIHDKYEDLEQLRADSLALGVGHCISQGTHPQDWLPQLELARRMPDFVTSCLAAHPSEVTNVRPQVYQAHVYFLVTYL